MYSVTSQNPVNFKRMKGGKGEDDEGEEHPYDPSNMFDKDKLFEDIKNRVIVVE